MIKLSSKQNKSNKGHPLDRYLCFFILPAGFSFLELILQLTATVMTGLSNIAAIILIAGGLGLFFEAICLFIGNRKVRFWFRFLILEVFTVWFLIMYFTDNSYRTFMDPASITQGAGDVVNEFGDTLVTILKSGLPMILIYHIPVFAYIMCSFKLSKNGKAVPILTMFIFLAGISCCVSGSFLLCRDSANVKKLTSQYSYDASMRSFGSTVTLAMNVKYSLFGNPYEGAFSTEETESDDPVIEETIYEKNALDIDFTALANETDDSALSAVYSYLSGLSASYQNEYTGLFEGKNLILICAEAFSKEVIDPLRTPTLYRLATEGIRFNDYYQPSWGGSTTTGEFSILTGIIPTNKVDSMTNITGHNNAFTIFNQLKSLGYNSFGYHNGEYDYYKRNKTHSWLGIDNWTGMGNGMEEGVTSQWPESDSEMFSFTIPKYIDSQPFCVYYMTISGHCNYSVMGNNMCARHYDEYDYLNASTMFKSYIACQSELEIALTTLVDSLEEAGIADDTVIVISADHYPYGMEKSVAWESDTDHLAELYGYEATTQPLRDHNALIIWSGCLEDMDEIVVDTPTYSLDILPTLSNLFGVEYDSRLLVGRDVFSDESPLVIWTNFSWKTDKGYYDASTGTFTPSDGNEVSDEYIEKINAIVQNKVSFSKTVLKYDFYELVLGE